MLELASRYESGGPVQVRKIAERHAVPSRFLVQIMLQLKAAGLVASTRGAGGYRLAVPPSQITLGQVMDIVEGNKQPDVNFAVSSSPDSPAVKALVQAWQDIQRKERDMLYSITFADLLERARQYDTQMYYI